MCNSALPVNPVPSARGTQSLRAGRPACQELQACALLQPYLYQPRFTAHDT